MFIIMIIWIEMIDVQLPITVACSSLRDAFDCCIDHDYYEDSTIEIIMMIRIIARIGMMDMK